MVESLDRVTLQREKLAFDRKKSRPSVYHSLSLISAFLVPAHAGLVRARGSSADLGGDTAGADWLLPISSPPSFSVWQVIYCLTA